MSFTKIRWTADDGVELHWTETKNGAIDNHEMTSADEPDAALPNALKAFVPLVRQACDLPATWDDEITVTGVTLNTEPARGGKPERDGIKVHFRYPASAFTADMLISTPHLRERLVDEPAGRGFIPDTWKEPLDALIAAAVAFVKGTRAQQALELAGTAK